MTWLLFLRRWWKPLAIVGALLVSHGLAAGLAYRYRDARADAQVATIRAQIANDARAQIEVAEKRAYDADEALRKALEAPKAAPAIDEVVHANPSRCVIPKPVGDRVRQAIREANSATAAR